MEAPTIGIARLIQEGGMFSVPSHQRDYSWTEDEIDQLFEDVLDAIEGTENEYFIGLMVFMPKGERDFTILDGQQRLATTIIILSAIRNWLVSRGFDKDADDIQRLYIASRELGSEDYHLLLVLNQNNNDFFERFVVRETPDEDIVSTLEGLKRYDPSHLLLEAILLCRKKIKEIAAVEGSDQDKAAHGLFRLVTFFQNNVKVVRLNVASEANAYTVFETLNDRGLDLSVLDLVKNHVFGTTTNESQLRDVQGRWAQMMANLANVPADDFLKTWWTSRHGRIQTAQLFPSFKKEISTPTKAVEVSKDLLKASEIYAALEIADDPLWSEVSNKSKARVRALRLLGGRQTKPILLSAIEKFPNTQLERLLHLLEIVIVRYQLIGGGRTGKLEISSAKLAEGIFSGKVETANGAKDWLKEVLPSDEDFRLAFLNKQERN
ncbi:MAG TPA: DUF262 domain-containing protein, partial [Candidatus Hodarchaeales archaeon]|nr:DUF262 domain-containing protein [Candidatus Hodarchaeales archaeon]